MTRPIAEAVSDCCKMPWVAPKKTALKPAAVNQRPKIKVTTKKAAKGKKKEATTAQKAKKAPTIAVANAEAPTNPPVASATTLEEAARAVNEVDMLPGLAAEDQHLLQDATGWSKQYARAQGLTMQHFLESLKY